MEHNTLFVNLFAGLGCGKSTHAAGVFYELKKQNAKAEYIQEYAKDATWREDFFTLGCQPYITGKQLFRQYRVNGKVDIAITDSPLLIGLAYSGFGVTDSYRKWLVEAQALFNNLNILLIRNTDVHPYQPYGRNQSEEQAKKIDGAIKIMLDDYGIEYHVIQVGDNSLNEILSLIEKNKLLKQ